MIHDHHTHLAQVSGDPTHTEGIREQFIKEVRQRFRVVRGDVRRVAGYDEDRLNLKQDASLADPEDIERFPTNAGKTRAFSDWLRGKMDEEVLEPVERDAVQNGEHWTATYIRSGYSRGWENAVTRLQEAGITVSESARDIFDLGVPQRQLRRLYTRAFENLKSVTRDAVPQVRDTLTQGLADGWNPRKMARKLADEVETLQTTRAEVLARTEVINSYSDATLDRYERAGADGVTVSGEFATAEDNRVCPICKSIAGAEYATDKMRSATFEYEAAEDEAPSLGGVYPVKPPVHPQCRCAILPVVG